MSDSNINPWAILESLDVIEVKPSYVRQFGVAAAIFLSQCLLSQRACPPERDGWFRIDQGELETLTGLTLDAQVNARARLKNAGVLDWRLEGLPATNAYCVDLEALIAVLMKGPELRENPFIPPDAPGFVYLMFCHSTNLYKIGISTAPEDRRVQVERVERARVDLLDVASAPSMGFAERYLQRRFAARRIRGEWFALSSEEADWVRLYFLEVGAP